MRSKDFPTGYGTRWFRDHACTSILSAKGYGVPSGSGGGDAVDVGHSIGRRRTQTTLNSLRGFGTRL